MRPTGSRCNPKCRYGRAGVCWPRKHATNTNRPRGKEPKMAAEDNKGVSLDEFIFRKLQPVRILRGYLAGEIELAEGESIAMSRMDLDNIVTTLDIFLEEYDRVSGFRGRK